MNIPGFSAEKSLYVTDKRVMFAIVEPDKARGDSITPASRVCTDDGLLCLVCSGGHCGVEDSILGISRPFF